MSKDITSKKHTQSKFLTLMIVPYSSKKMHSIKIPHWFFHLAFGIVLTIASVAMFFYLRTAYFQTLASDKDLDLKRSIEMNVRLQDEKSKAAQSYIEQSKEQRQTYQEKLEYYDQKAKELEDKLKELDNAKEELYDLIGRDSQGGVPMAMNLGYQYALGGAEETSLDMAFEILEMQVAEVSLSYDELTSALHTMKEQERERERKKAEAAALLFGWPVRGIITSEVGSRGNPFGVGSEYHTGIDISVPIGTSVKASFGGVVKFAGVMNGYGNIVIISHSSGLESYYGHNSKLLVSAGQRIEKGDEIALSGNTGRSTGPHVHFEVRLNGQIVNPRKYM